MLHNRTGFAQTPSSRSRAQCRAKQLRAQTRVSLQAITPKTSLRFLEASTVLNAVMLITIIANSLRWRWRVRKRALRSHQPQQQRPPQPSVSMTVLVQGFLNRCASMQSCFLKSRILVHNYVAIVGLNTIVSHPRCRPFLWPHRGARLNVHIVALSILFQILLFAKQPLLLHQRQHSVQRQSQHQWQHH